VRTRSPPPAGGRWPLLLLGPALLGAAGPDLPTALGLSRAVVGALIVLLSLHGLHRLALLLRLVRPAAARPLPPPISEADLPVITVQLPIYNERDVAGRLIDAAAALDWPADRLELQVLDDSTDDTRAAVDAAAERARAAGRRVQILRRSTREGFKAGALAAALPSAAGALIAIFDADFVPAPGDLRALCRPFADPGVGLVQARWGHLNAEANLLTRAQEVLLDAHFLIEHAARAKAGHFFNFNGTAGLWRRAAIEQAGGWSAATLTEDLDLSYRAQLAGWRFVYLPELVIPAELPDEIDAFLGQQARWAAGTVQVAARLGPRLARAPLPLGLRAEGLAHLLAPLAWPLSAALSLSLGPLAVARALSGAAADGLDLLAFALSAVTLGLFYGAAAVAGGGPRRLLRLPLVMALGVGISLRQAAAVLGAGRPGARVFARTPKSGGAGAAAGTGSYRAPARLRWPELALAVENIVCAVILGLHGRWASVPFLLLFGAGAALVAGLGARRR
jgi:hypothetical protein